MWEYKIIHSPEAKTEGIFKGKEDKFVLWAERLNELGKQGWELVAILYDRQSFIGAYAIFKRPIK